jgi:hypothetical protein
MAKHANRIIFLLLIFLNILDMTKLQVAIDLLTTEQH